MGYEGDFRWHAAGDVLLRYGGHNPGGGGEQHSEVWTLDPGTWTWTLKTPDLSPPGVCCAQQNADDPVGGRYLRFPSFSGSHGWQWRREIDLNQSSVWSYELATNRWRDRRPMPAPSLSPLRAAAWDADHDVVVVFGGEGSREGTLVYDPYANAWTRMRPAKEPEFRSGGNLAYDAARRIHVLFGSQFSNDPHTWAYDLRANEWRDLAPATSPPTDKNDAVLVYDPGKRHIVALVKVGDAAETWTFDAGAREWKKANPPREPDPAGNRTRVLTWAPGLGAVLENCPSKPREQQVWTYGDGKAPAPRLKTLTATATPEGMLLEWDPPVEAPVRRGMAEHPWKADYAEIGSGTGRYVDRLEAGRSAFYEVEGRRVRSRPPAVEDVVVSVLAADRVEVAWTAVPGATAYVIERAAAEPLSEDQLKPLKSRTPPLSPPSVAAWRRIGAFAKVGESKGLSWEDRKVELSKPALIGETIWEKTPSKEAFDPEGTAVPRGVYFYRVRARNALELEGGPSAATPTIPSPVRGLFSQEDGTTARLRWAASAEKGLKGYRVYRMDGRFDKEPVSRLTMDPIAEREYADPEAGRKSRRYMITAVDAIGQEGQPSSPAWHEREWKSHYQPFTEPWHQ
jgi:hypothetical protein